jgi:REP element-mobilizing transposase RayT
MSVRLYAHLSWTTFGRLPLINEAVAAFLGRFLLREAHRHRVRVLEIGVVRDHVHMILQLPAAFDIPRMVQGFKGASARIANRDHIARHESLRWANGYDLRSIGIRQLKSAVTYFRNQSSFRSPAVAEPPLQGTDN